MARTIDELLAANLDRVAIPADEGGDALFTESNPGYITDPLTQQIFDAMDDHNHGDRRWWGSLPDSVVNDTNAIAATVGTPYIVASGPGEYGEAIPVVGKYDNPVLSHNTHFSLDRITVADPGNLRPWRIRFIYGETTVEDAVAAGYWTETMFIGLGIGAVNLGSAPITIRMPMLPLGWKVWAQGWNAVHLTECEFFIGCHGSPVPTIDGR